jgi:SAM-dependent methyltransferase
VSDAKRHYEALLGPIYAWSVSRTGDPVARAAAWLERHELLCHDTYLDLGAGFGAHALALLGVEKQVTAVDFDPTLVAELQRAAAPYASHLLLEREEMLDFLRRGSGATWDVILCVGDTLTHLPTVAAVAELVGRAARSLSDPGRLALSYRDSTRFAAEGVERFREVASDGERTMHCLLEPLDDGHLRVTDIVTEVGPDGPRTRLSDYVKLRLAPDDIVALAANAGLVLERRSEDAGMTTLIFARGYSAAL